MKKERHLKIKVITTLATKINLKLAIMKIKQFQLTKIKVEIIYLIIALITNKKKKYSIKLKKLLQCLMGSHNKSAIKKVFLQLIVNKISFFNYFCYFNKY